MLVLSIVYYQTPKRYMGLRYHTLKRSSDFGKKIERKISLYFWSKLDVIVASISFRNQAADDESSVIHF